MYHHSSYKKMILLAILSLYIGSGFSFLFTQGTIIQTEQGTIIQNGNFETGNIDGWTPSGQVSVVGVGTDTISGNSLQRVAEGQYSAKIGDEIPWGIAGSQFSSLEQTISLPQNIPQNTVLQFVFAVVANDPPDHQKSDKPYFQVLVQDLTSNLPLNPDPAYIYTSQTSSDWYIGGSSAGTGNWYNRIFYGTMQDQWVYRPWKQETIPLNNLGSHKIKISLVVRDCNPSAHAIYAYLDAVSIGAKSNINIPQLIGNPVKAVYKSPPFWAPLFAWIEWTGALWLCTLLPILLLLAFLLWLLLRRREPLKQSILVPPSQPEEENTPKLTGGIIKKN